MAQREELEARLKEQRLAEATKKGLTGATGKIGAVLKTLGSPIVGQVEGTNFIDTEGRGDDDGGESLGSIPVMDMDGVERPSDPYWSSDVPDSVSFGMYSVGRHFDGLGRGMHLEIIYKEESSEMSVYHRGRLVYREIQGDLVCYVPSEEWEGWVSSLFKVAKKQQREEKEAEFQSKIQEAERRKNSWLRDLASRWGLT